MTQRSELSGAFSNEATRVLILIVAGQPFLRRTRGAVLDALGD